jgi:KDO2-lipid IV(A) lauroyltransferase
LSLKYDVPVFMSRITRKDGAHFHMTIDPPFHFDKTGDDEKDVLAAMTKINGIVENWIRETPGQWFWVHRRWPKD